VFEPDASLEQQLEALRNVYAQELPGRIEELEALWKRMEARRRDHHTLQALTQRAHQLAGSGATFGFTALSDAARALERRLRSLEIEELSDLAREQIASMLKTLRHAAARPADVRPQRRLTAVMPALRAGGASPASRVIALIEPDPQLAASLALQLDCFGYRVRTSWQASALPREGDGEPPLALVIDTQVLTGEHPLGTAADAIEQTLPRPVPRLFISADGSLDSRARASRAGADAYFTLPLDIGYTVATLDALASADPYRVLIVEDEPAPAAFYADILRRANIVPRILDEPDELIEALAEFRPDVVVMDLYVHGYTGMELARVIAQMDVRDRRRPHMPIVFVSVETDPARQLEAMRWGAVDFVQKPVQPARLASSVMVQALRSRLQAIGVERDAVTGLQGSNLTWELLDTTLVRAKRHGGAVALGILDIDETRPPGDANAKAVPGEAIAALAGLLRQRLRRSDVIGRCGAALLAVILDHTDASGARIVLDEVRVSFPESLQRSSLGRISATLSCGVAAYPDYQNAVAVCHAAEQALQRAHDGGSNVVVLAGS
jgi:diguanylate cyclase (GGDEF)-like protein